MRHDFINLCRLPQFRLLQKSAVFNSRPTIRPALSPDQPLIQIIIEIPPFRAFSRHVTPAGLRCPTTQTYRMVLRCKCLCRNEVIISHAAAIDFERVGDSGVSHVTFTSHCVTDSSHPVHLKSLISTTSLVTVPIRTTRSASAEGTVAKKIYSKYESGRTRDWLKVKTSAGKEKMRKRVENW